MATERVIIDARLRPMGTDGHRWELVTVVGGDKIWVHGFPESTVAQVMAEYGLGHDEVKAGLDIVLHECFIVDPMIPRNFQTDIGWQRGFRTEAPRNMHAGIRAGDEIPKNLWSADSVAEARYIHELRIDKVKRLDTFYAEHDQAKVEALSESVRHRFDDREVRGVDPLSLILESTKIDPEKYDQAVELVRRFRRSFRGLPKDYLTDADIKRLSRQSEMGHESYAQRERAIASHENRHEPSWVTLTLDGNKLTTSSSKQVARQI